MKDPIYPRMLWRAPERYGLEPKALDTLMLTVAFAYVLFLMLIGGFFLSAIPAGAVYLIGQAVFSKKNEEDSRFFSSYTWSLTHRNKVIVPKKMTPTEAKKIRL